MKKTFYGTNIPNPYYDQTHPTPSLILVGGSIFRRLESFGMSLEDVADPDKMYGVLTPREFNLFYTLCDFTYPIYPRLSDLLGSDFLPFNKYSIISQKEQQPTETSRKYIDDLRYCNHELMPHEAISLQLGYSIEKVPEQLAFSLSLIGENLFAGIISEHVNESVEQYDYNVCNETCDKLNENYGSRWVANTKAFSSLIRLSQLSALNRNS
jgi:hypothetical protein